MFAMKTFEYNMKWLNMDFQVVFGLSTDSTMFPMKTFEYDMECLNMHFQVVLGLSTDSTMFTTKTFEYIMKWLFFLQSNYSTLFTMTRYGSVMNLLNMWV